MSELFAKPTTYRYQIIWQTGHLAGRVECVKVNKPKPIGDTTYLGERVRVLHLISKSK